MFGNDQWRDKDLLQLTLRTMEDMKSSYNGIIALAPCAIQFDFMFYLALYNQDAHEWEQKLVEW